MKICVYSPYIPKHVGGGEKYVFDVVRLLIQDGHEVSVAMSVAQFDEQEVRQKYERFLDFSLAKVKFISTPIGTAAGFFKKLWWTKNFDVMYYVTDGSLFFSLAKKNILHIQFPFVGEKKGLLERAKLKNWPVKNANSLFTKNVIEKHWQTSVEFVHYPMVAQPTQPPKLTEKEKIILHVGRFFAHTHTKRQDILVEIFQDMVDQFPKEMKGWKLLLVGSVEEEDYAQKVAKMVKDYPIEILHQTTRAELLQWYRRAAIYWHATGYDVDPEKEPIKVEHFGISTVEAMSYGCAPVVIGKGGQIEVVGIALQSLLWQTKQECAEKTLRLVSDQKLRAETAQLAIEQSKNFGEARFHQTLEKMINL